jgi:hypothetical protein
MIGEDVYAYPFQAAGGRFAAYDPCFRVQLLETNMPPLHMDCPKDAAPRQDWSAHLTTRTGFVFPVRRAGPGDEAALSHFFTRVKPDDMRFRFLSSALKISPEQLAGMTHVDHALSEHFVALDPVDGQIIASAMLGADRDRKAAEVAIAVDGAHRAGGSAG